MDYSIKSAVIVFDVKDRLANLTFNRGDTFVTYTARTLEDTVRLVNLECATCAFQVDFFCCLDEEVHQMFARVGPSYPLKVVLEMGKLIIVSDHKLLGNSVVTFPDLTSMPVPQVNPGRRLIHPDYENIFDL